MIELIDVSKAYAKKPILENINLFIPDGEILVIFGPNGCGKTTLLKIIAKLEKQDRGELIYDNEEMRCGFVFQHHNNSLFQWKTVQSNFFLALECLKIDKKEKIERVEKMLRRLNLLEHRHKYPYQLSGGLSQLAAIGRSLVASPDVLLLDEPFSSLDYHSRFRLRNKLLELHSDFGIPMVIVTHSPDDAIVLAKRVVVLSQDPSTVTAIIENPERESEILETCSGFLYE